MQRCCWHCCTPTQAKVVLCAMFGMAVADGYVDYNPFHDVKIPKVPGRRAIKVATPEQPSPALPASGHAVER